MHYYMGTLLLALSRFDEEDLQRFFIRPFTFSVFAVSQLRSTHCDVPLIDKS